MTAARRGARRGGGAPPGSIDVARAGRRVDLLIDGISYSTFHPDRPWSGYVWDALAAAGLLSRQAAPRVLMLGGGGGTALLLLRRVLPEARLTAVELDPRVVELARDRFDLDRVGAEIVIDDGLAYLASTRRRFDLILDDMYAPSADGLRRPVPDEHAHLARVASRLEPGGIAATNSTTDDDPPGLEREMRRVYRAVFPHVVSLTPRLGYNVVLAGSRRPLALDEYRERATHQPPIDSAGIAAVRAARL